MSHVISAQKVMSRKKDSTPATLPAKELSRKETVKSGGTGILPVSPQHGQDGQATESLVARASCPCRPSMAKMARPQRVWWHGHLARGGPAWPRWPGHIGCGRFAPLRTLGEQHGLDLGQVLRQSHTRSDHRSNERARLLPSVRVVQLGRSLGLPFIRLIVVPEM